MTECFEKGLCDTEICRDENSTLENLKFLQKGRRLYQGHFQGMDTLHQCDDVCPYCKGCCSLPYGHVGLHSLKMHRKVGSLSCDLKFYNNFIYPYIKGIASDIPLQEILKEWKSSGWENCLVSILGSDYLILNKKSESSAKQAEIKRKSSDDFNEICKIF